MCSCRLQQSLRADLYTPHRTPHDELGSDTLPGIALPTLTLRIYGGIPPLDVLLVDYWMQWPSIPYAGSNDTKPSS
jgi:hypothetical protein